MTHQCPQGHPSTTPDFCSVCGAEVGQKVTAPPAADRAACPDCDTPREGPAQVFCEVCGFNFRTAVSGEGQGVVKVRPRQTPPAPPPTGAVTTPVPGDTPAGAPWVRWEVIIRVDANLYGTPNPDAPTEHPSQTFTLFEEENLIGRKDSRIRTQVPILNDPGVSRRQALLLHQPDGGLVLRDLNSSNGTQLNGKELVPGADALLKDGDTIAVGAWTCLAVRAVIL
jgi:hypothetical protein